MDANITIAQAVKMYQEIVSSARSANTARSYANAMHAFSAMLNERNLPAEKTKVSVLSEDAVSWFAAVLKPYAPATEQLYLTAVAGFFEFLAAEGLAEPNLPRMRRIIKLRSRKAGKRLPQFPKEYIVILLMYANNLAYIDTANNIDKLRNLRDRALLIVLADTGLRIHEACNLRRGDLDWNEHKAVIIGKGDRQDVVRFSQRSIEALQEYLNARSALDGNSGRPLASLPLFARHDKGAGKKVKQITTTTGRNIVKQRIRQALGEEATRMITPHSFRHYFVTTVLTGSGGNLKLAQELARHRNITVTQRYAHLSDEELDKGYWDIFEGA